jgi:dipeptidyl aminopeptidase/acylaminoacyl peptidase
MKHSDFRALFGLSAFSEEEALRIYVQRQFSRIVAHGVDYDVAQRVVSRITAFDQWAPEWAREGEYWEAIAVDARRRRHRTTAMNAFFLASNCFRVAQHILHDDAAKMAYYHKVVSLYETAGKLMSPPVKRVSIRSPQGSLHAYLSVPAGRGRFPAVILAGGADGWREEYLPITRILLERGFAVLNVDAPGQGAARLFKQTGMPVDVETFFSAAVDFLLKTPHVHRQQIFMVGHSVGGYLTLRTAAADRRLAGCAALGAPFELLSIFDASPPARRINFSLLCGTRELDQGREILRHFTLEGLLSNISCPVLIVHGMKDTVVPYSHVERICSDIRSPVELRTFEHGIHTCDNHVGEVYPLIADRFLDCARGSRKKSQ